jgi:hypothetical protein
MPTGLVFARETWPEEPDRATPNRQSFAKFICECHRGKVGREDLDMSKTCDLPGQLASVDGVGGLGTSSNHQDRKSTVRMRQQLNECIHIACATLSEPGLDSCTPVACLMLTEEGANDCRRRELVASRGNQVLVTASFKSDSY